MSRKSRKRFGKLKGAARVEKENSCSAWMTNFFAHLFKRETTKLEFKDIQNSHQNCSKGKLVRENTMTGAQGSCSLQVMGSCFEWIFFFLFLCGGEGGSNSLYLISLYPNNQVHKQQTWHPRSQRSLMGPSFPGCFYLQNLPCFSWKNCITSTPCLVKCTASWSPSIVINCVQLFYLSWFVKKASNIFRGTHVRLASRHMMWVKSVGEVSPKSRILVSAMICLLLKKPLSICQSDWSEIRNAFPVILESIGCPEHGYQHCFTDFTNLC